MANLAGKNALVTGGASGIGRAVVELFLREGAQVVAVNVDGAKLAQVTMDLETYGPKLHTIAGDLASEPGTEAVAKNALDHFGGIDILVNIAPSGTRRSPSTSALTTGWPGASFRAWSSAAAVPSSPSHLPQAWWAAEADRSTRPPSMQP